MDIGHCFVESEQHGMDWECDVCIDDGFGICVEPFSSAELRHRIGEQLDADQSCYDWRNERDGCGTGVLDG